jgi:hypothetical protein
MNNLRPELSLYTSALIDALQKAHDAARNLTSQRLAAKLSTSRSSGIARELRELLKVISACEL